MNAYEKILIGVITGWSLATLEFTYKLNKETGRMIKEREQLEKQLLEQ